jgi:hypothetical protein
MFKHGKHESHEAAASTKYNEWLHLMLFPSHTQVRLFLLQTNQ